MSKVYDEEPSPPGSIGLSTKEQELLDRETRQNGTIDTRLRNQVDKDPRAAWWLYPVALLYNMSVSAIFYSSTSLFFNSYDYDRDRVISRLAQIGLMMNFLPLLGSTLTDSYLGKWWTLVTATLVFLIGTIALIVVTLPALASSIPVNGTFAVLVITGIAMALINPAIEAFGGDQFLAVQESGRARFFALLYFSTNLGFVVGSFAFPALGICSDGVPCFLLRGILILCSLTLILPILLIGRRRFRTVPPTGEFIPFKMVKAIVVGVKRYWAASPADRAAGGHWLNFAAKDHGSLFVQEVHDLGLALAPVLLPIYLSTMVADHFQSLVSSEMSQYLADSQGHRSRRIDWNQIIPLFGGLVLILTLAFGIFPLMKRRGWNVSPHRRLGAGLVCGFLAFVVAVIVDKVLKSKGDPVWSNRYDSLAVCQNCVHYAVTVPQCLFQAFYVALVTPATMNIAYDEVGRHFRTFSSAIVAAVFPLARLVKFGSDLRWYSPDEYTSEYSDANGKYIGIGIGGLVFYFAAMYFYTPRKLRPSINNVGHTVKDAEYLRT